MRPHDEDRFLVLFHKRMHTKISGRFGRGGKDGGGTHEIGIRMALGETMSCDSHWGMDQD
jgi:hypothetical protein